MTLAMAQKGKTYTIGEVAGKYRRRLTDIGFVRGAEVVFFVCDPAGETMLFGLDGFCVALRKAAAGEIEVSENV